MLGHRRQRARSARARALGGQGPRAAARRTPISIRRTATPPTSTPTRDAARRARGSIREAGVHSGQVRSTGPYASLDPRQPSLDALERTERYVRPCGRRSARGATCSSARTGSSRRRARSASPVDSRPSIRSGSRSPTPPESPEAMAHVARATSIPVATGERLTTEFEFARVLETRSGVHPAAQPRAGSADCSRPARSLRSQRCATRRLRPTSTADRSSGLPPSSSGSPSPTSCCSRASAPGTGSTPTSSEADPLGGRLRARPRRAGPRRRARRGGRRPAPLRR